MISDIPLLEEEKTEIKEVKKSQNKRKPKSSVPKTVKTTTRLTKKSPGKRKTPFSAGKKTNKKNIRKKLASNIKTINLEEMDTTDLI